MQTPTLSPDPCPLCEGSGLRIAERPDGSRIAHDCDCRVERRVARTLTAARIPERYYACSLETYETDFDGATPSQSEALFLARKFVESYPLGNRGGGLLLTGTLGVGKTHLAIGILKALIQERGVNGLFFDYKDLLKQVQNSYNRQVHATELEVLAPVFKAEVLVLDDLGAAKPTEWVWDTVAHILNARYNERRTTIITTNYPNEASLGVERDSSAFPEMRVQPETLGDRITDRMRSRLQEMCCVINIEGIDLRLSKRRARFS